MTINLNFKMMKCLIITFDTKDGILNFNFNIEFIYPYLPIELINVAKEIISNFMTGQHNYDLLVDC